MYAYNGQPFESNADTTIGFAYNGKPFIAAEKLSPGKFKIDSNKNFYSSGSQIVKGTKVSFKSNGNVEASAFSVVSGVFRFNSDGSISANSFIQDAIL